MQIIADNFYHIYNQGNNREYIFRVRSDYIMFLKKFRQKVLDHCEAVSYCLMPNHFHFLINATKRSASPITLGKIESTRLANGFRLLCSSYANDFNKKYNRTGSLFRQKTKAKNLEIGSINYPFFCFHYIHQNPMVAGLCKKMEEWEFSSFRDYCGLRDGSLVAKQLAHELIAVSQSEFYEESYEMVDKAKIE